MSMKFERDERKFDFHDIGCEIKRKRETSGMTQDQLALIIDRDPRTIIYNENDGQHPSLNTFYQMVTMFDIPTLNGTARFRQQSVWCLCCYTVKHPQFMACAAKLLSLIHI